MRLFYRRGKMIIEEINLQEILDARERRAVAQSNLLKQYDNTVVSFSMNIAGEVKNTPLIELAFWAAIERIETEVNATILYKNIIQEKTGPEALYVFNQEADTIKHITVEIENANPIGRLFDIDVIDRFGKKLSREIIRTCLVCDGPVTICSRNRAHGLSVIKSATQELLLNFACEKLASFAVESLIEEAVLAPKPGLVDSINNGAHKDMNLDMLCRSAGVLRPYFADCVRFGAEDDKCIDTLQKAGICAENTMLKETCGINTHKGAIFAMGIYLGALGGYLSRGGNLFNRCSNLALQKSNNMSFTENTHGDLVRKEFRKAGAIEEACQGFPTATKAAKALKESGGDALYALLIIMESTIDSNLLYRGGQAALDFVQNESTRILKLPSNEQKNALVVMDEECIRKNISPGGAADMLALSILISKISQIVNF